MSYTQGEWEVTRWESHKDIHVSAKDAWGNYVFVANCGNPKSDSLPTNENAEDNAKLIASAPELYEALKSMLDWYNPTGILRDKVLSAIAKAEGK